MTTHPDLPTSRRACALRLGFAGTPAFAARILAALIDAGCTPAVVFCQPDRPAGRGRRLAAPPVKELALQHGLPVEQPRSLKAPAVADALRGHDLDVLVVAAYGLILPPAVLVAPRLGCINVHASLLPRWRGAAPIERAMLAGDAETGVSIMQMDEGLDTGPVFLTRRCPIEPGLDAPALEARLAELGATALLECLQRLPDLTAAPQPDAGVTYADKLTRADSALRWSEPASLIERKVRALAGRMPPHGAVDSVRVTLLEASAEDAAGGGPCAPQALAAPPGTILSAGSRGIRVACGEGALNITRLKLNLGKGRPLSAADAVNGYGRLFTPGRCLDPAEPAP